MTVLAVTIKKKKAIKTLEELKANNLIDFIPKNTFVKSRLTKEKFQPHLASENVLAKYWLTSKEDEAWQDL